MLQIRPGNAVWSPEPRRCWGLADNLEEKSPLRVQRPRKKHLEGNINKKALQKKTHKTKHKEVTGTEIKKEDTSACNSGGITNSSQN